uniref:Uncharacterized protein n=3 Tax=Parascaris univalens TaxID=6257 RepID=A0A915AIB2_PARUN
MYYMHRSIVLFADVTEMISATDTSKMSTPTPSPVSPISSAQTPQTPGSANTPTPITSETDGKTPENVVGGSTTAPERPKQNQNNDEQWNESTPRDVFSEASLEEPNTIETDIGQDTEALSDYSEGRDAAGFRSRTSSSSSRFMSWMIRMSPLILNRRIFVLAIFNFIMSALNIVLLLGLIALIIQFAVLNLMNTLDYTGENPCIFEYHNWGKCSGKCWNSNRIEDRPKRIRYVNAKTIVNARGRRFEGCPANLRNEFEEIPCNFYKCERNLSSYSWGDECFLNDVSKGKEGGCYRIRNISFDDDDRLQLIRIDTHLTEPCNMTDCSDYW